MTESIMTIDEKGNKFWKNENGELHRTDGPAWEGFSGNKAYYVSGLPHRTDGPAVIWSDGFETWHLNGNHYLDEKSFRKALENMEKCQNKSSLLRK